MLSTLSLGTAVGEAQPPRKFYGVVSQTPLAAADFTRMGQGQVGTLRVQMPWAAIDPSPLAGDLEWRAFDSIVANATRQGVHVFPMIYGTPRWLAPLEGCDEEPASCYVHAPQTQTGLSAWRQFLQEAVQRYGPTGRFWLEHPELIPQHIRSWQIWNEENSASYFAPRPDPSRYADLVSAASEAIHAEDAGATVVLGGMFATPGGKRGISAHAFLRQLYNIPGFEQAFEGIAIHPYAPISGRVDEVKSQVTRLRSVAKKAGDAQVGLWVTEIGWGSGGGEPLNPGSARQATRLRQALRYLTRNRVRLRVALVAWYAWRDAAEPGVCGFCPDSGLFELESLRPKPAWAEFVRFTGGR